MVLGLVARQVWLILTSRLKSYGYTTMGSHGLGTGPQGRQQIKSSPTGCTTQEEECSKGNSDMSSYPVQI